MQPCRRVSFTIPDHKSHMELNCGIQFNCLNFHYLSLITSFHTLSFLFFLPNIIFLIERRLQCCVGFCHTVIQVSHNYIYIISSLSLPPLPPFQPSRSAQITRLGFLCYTATSHQLPILHMVAFHTFFFLIN